MSYRLFAAAAGVMLLSACDTVAPQAGSLDSGWGEASKYNAAVQIINPDPVYTADMAQPGDNGEKAANATLRYRTDRVKEPHPVTTTSKTSGGSGGSGGGSSGPQ